jgi:hypothetical protein
MAARVAVWVWVAALLACGAVAPACAQSGAGSKAPADPNEGALMLPLKAGTALHGGRLVLAQGTARPGREERFGVEGLSVLQPAVVTVLPRDAKAALTLQVRRWGESQGGQSADVGAAGLAQVAFRTQPDAGITVLNRGKVDMPYQLALWVGPEMRPPLPTPFKPARAEALRSGSGRKP